MLAKRRKKRTGKQVGGKPAPARVATYEKTIRTQLRPAALYELAVMWHRDRDRQLFLPHGARRTGSELQDRFWAAYDGGVPIHEIPSNRPEDRANLALYKAGREARMVEDRGRGGRP